MIFENSLIAKTIGHIPDWRDILIDYQIVNTSLVYCCLSRHNAHWNLSTPGHHTPSVHEERQCISTEGTKGEAQPPGPRAIVAAVDVMAREPPLPLRAYCPHVDTGAKRAPRIYL